MIPNWNRTIQPFGTRQQSTGCSFSKHQSEKDSTYRLQHKGRIPQSCTYNCSSIVRLRSWKCRFKIQYQLREESNRIIRKMNIVEYCDWHTPNRVHSQGCPTFGTITSDQWSLFGRFTTSNPFVTLNYSNIGFVKLSRMNGIVLQTFHAICSTLGYESDTILAVTKAIGLFNKSMTTSRGDQCQLDGTTLTPRRSSTSRH